MSSNVSTTAAAMPFGARLTKTGVHFSLWAPLHPTMGVLLSGEKTPRPMVSDGGWHHYEAQGAQPGLQYRFVLPDGRAVPDPASRFQPEDVHGPSEVLDPDSYRWTQQDWNGRPWEELVIYELHVGAFTPEGTFLAAIDRLGDLAQLGVTAIELMPIADFPGARNWGYDGVLLFAPDSSYGRPDDLKALIDAAHRLGIAVILDVIYNHFGPDGNYLPSYAPIFTEKHHTPWGSAINYDGDRSEPVRQFVISNAVYWITEYRFDGLRLDAVHAIMDDGPSHILADIAAAIRRSGGRRHIHLILENEENHAVWLDRESGTPTKFNAQWNDDLHHVLHTAVTGESSGYYADYKGDAAKLARAIAEGFAFQGDLMPYRGSCRGEPSTHLPPAAFVSFLQNHDQIGNRAFGERITKIAPAAAIRAAAAVYLLAPQIPMLFMGEEWAASTPFPFFCDFNPELAALVRAGRRAEFARFPEFQDKAQRDRIPDPTAENTFLAAKLRWDERSDGAHREWLEWYQRILRVRREEIIPRLGEIAHAGSHEIGGDGAVFVHWVLRGGAILHLAANLSDRDVECPVGMSGRMIWLEGVKTGRTLGPGSVAWLMDG